MGDLSYNDGSRRIDEFRAHYRFNLGSAGYRSAFGGAGVYPTWDDHEVDNDFDPERLRASDPELLETATRAYFETLPLPEERPRRLWRSHRWGRTAEIFMLDCRSERRPSTRRTADATYLGAEQMAWLEAALERSPCHFKLIASSVPITALFGLWNFALADRWEGYAAQRRRLLDHLAERVSGRIVFLSGDFHCGFVSRVEPSGPARAFIEVATSTGPLGPNPIGVLHDLGDISPEETFPPDRFLFATGNPRNATTLRFDPGADEVRVRFLDARPDTSGQVLFDQRISFGG